jgi:hypothetical protein
MTGFNLWRMLMRVLATAGVIATLTGCVASNGDTIFFKHLGLVDTAIGRMELVKPLGLPFSLGSPLRSTANSRDFSKPTIFLSDDITEASINHVYWVGGSSIVVINASTATCKYAYVLISINRYSKYFGRVVTPCDHQVSFTSTPQGVLATETNVADPNVWLMSDRSFAGPVRQASLAPAPRARPDAAERLAPVASQPRPTNQKQAPNSPPSPQASSTAFVARPHIQDTAEVSRRLDLTSKPVPMLDIPTGPPGPSKPASICMGDSRSCSL